MAVQWFFGSGQTVGQEASEEGDVSRSPDKNGEKLRKLEPFYEGHHRKSLKTQSRS